jgi:hypothetical protein
MTYRGRSPLKDVARSVVMGAGMISPALLDACATNPPTTTAPVTSGSTTGIPSAAVSATIGGVPSAPPTDTVRPRTNPTSTSMPTRGFSGAGRARG